METSQIVLLALSHFALFLFGFIIGAVLLYIFLDRKSKKDFKARMEHQEKMRKLQSQHVPFPFMLMTHGTGNDLEEMSIPQLEAEMKKAISEDRFEDVNSLKEEIEKRKTK